MTRDQAVEKAQAALAASRGQPYPNEYGYEIGNVADLITVLEALGMPFDQPAAPVAAPTQQPAQS